MVVDPELIDVSDRRYCRRLESANGYGEVK